MSTRFVMPYMASQDGAKPAAEEPQADVAPVASTTPNPAMSVTETPSITATTAAEPPAATAPLDSPATATPSVTDAPTSTPKQDNPAETAVSPTATASAPTAKLDAGSNPLSPEAFENKINNEEGLRQFAEMIADIKSQRALGEQRAQAKEAAWRQDEDDRRRRLRSQAIMAGVYDIVKNLGKMFYLNKGMPYVKEPRNGSMSAQMAKRYAAIDALHAEDRKQLAKDAADWDRHYEKVLADLAAQRLRTVSDNERASANREFQYNLANYKDALARERQAEVNKEWDRRQNKQQSDRITLRQTPTAAQAAGGKKGGGKKGGGKKGGGTSGNRYVGEKVFITDGQRTFRRDGTNERITPKKGTTIRMRKDFYGKTNKSAQSQAAAEGYTIMGGSSSGTSSSYDGN